MNNPMQDLKLLVEQKANSPEEYDDMVVNISEHWHGQKPYEELTPKEKAILVEWSIMEQQISSFQRGKRYEL